MIGSILWFLALLTGAVYAVFLLLCYFLFARLKTKTTHTAVQRSVAVIIAARNEEANMAALLKALEEQQCSFTFDVIVVDDASEDRTLKIAQAHWAKKIRLSAISNHGTGKKDAITTGVNSTAAELILVTDADCIPDAQWVQTMAQQFNDPQCCFVAGMIRPRYGDGVVGAALATEAIFLQMVSAGLYASGNPVMCNGASMGFTRQLFLQVGGFTNDPYVSGDDVLLLQKAARYAPQGIRWVKDQRAMVEVRVAENIPEAVAQRHRWLSKSKAYSNPLLRITGILFLAVQLLLPALVLALPLWGVWDNPFWLGLGIKIAVELLILSLASSFFRETNAIILLPASVVMYCIISLGAVFRLYGSNVEWKGRSWREGRVR
jgi:cellulose synthase/poly-beta-1,6-N-acetylglucosamine synthase-like glycosyltransferase